MKQKKREVPILYSYIYRNIKNSSNVNCIVPLNSIIPSMRKVVHTCPRIIQMDIFQEMETMGLLRMIGTDKCMILNNKDCEKKLKEYAFPIHP